MTCSGPPAYESTGSIRSVRSRSQARSCTSLEGYRRKYQAESRKVSETSVSRRADPPHEGQAVYTKDSAVARGETPVPVGRKSATAGRTTGRSSSGTGTVPQSAQYTMGIGGPQ